MNHSTTILGLILLGTIIIIGIDRSHVHESVTCQYAQGFKSYTLTFCVTDSAQVTRSGTHLQNERAVRYFEGELENCR